MHIGENIKKYRKHNHITQEELAQKLALTRQSISKWENGETLPSIDNLIALSSLLDVSLDELIIGEAYLHFPFEYGTIKHRKTLYTFLFSPTVLAILTAWNAFPDFSQNSTYLIMALFLQLLLYPLFIYVFPLKKSRLYTHWTLTKKAIVVPIYKLNFWTELWLPIKELVHRETKTIPIQDIDHIKLSIDPFPLDPNLGKSLYGGYFARNISVMSEPFFLILYTKQNEQYSLDLSGYYFKETADRKMLYTILLFLKRKQIPIQDPHHLIPTIKKRESVIDTLYTDYRS